jgi:MerR family mercuric resistance operon transcriptional regulator
MQSTDLTIGRLAQEGGVGVETVRYYQRRRLLTVPAKRNRGFRYCGSEALERLRFIRRAQSLGLSLEDVRVLLRLDRKGACGAARALAAQRLALIEAKLNDLSILRNALASIIQECDQDGSASCPVLVRLSREPGAKDARPESQALTSGGARNRPHALTSWMR